MAAGPIAQLRNEPQHFFKIKRVSSKVLMQSYIHYHFCEFSSVFHQIRWDANKPVSCTSIFEWSALETIRTKQNPEMNTSAWVCGLRICCGERGLGTVLNVLVAHCSMCIHSFNICRSIVTSCRQITYPCHKTFIPSFSYANSIKKNTIFLRENGDGLNLYNSIWNKMLKNKNHKIIK